MDKQMERHPKLPGSRCAWVPGSLLGQCQSPLLNLQQELISSADSCFPMEPGVLISYNMLCLLFNLASLTEAWKWAGSGFYTKVKLSCLTSSNYFLLSTYSNWVPCWLVQGCNLKKKEQNLLPWSSQSKSVVLNHFPPAGGIWWCPETLSIVTAKGGYYWHLIYRGQRC